MAEIPQSEIDYQLSHRTEFNGEGLNAFMIIGICVCTVLVGLRLWSRKYIQCIGWHADDYTIVIALLFTIASGIVFCVQVEQNGYGRHFLALDKNTQTNLLKVFYAYNLLYTVGYPLSKISLTLLYQRIFILRWFNICCWILIALFSGYAISTGLVNIWLTIPINAYWDISVRPKRVVNETELFKANAYFNIITDFALLVLPLSVLWRLKMSGARKVGLSIVFAIGVLTMIASILRLVFFFRVNSWDHSYTLMPEGFWTGAEQFLGIICPTLPTLHPLIKSAWEKSTSGSSRSDSNPTGTTQSEKARSFRDRIRRQRSDNELLRKAEPGLTSTTRTTTPPPQAPPPETVPMSNEAALKTLDPRYAGPDMGNTTDAHFTDDSYSGSSNERMGNSAGGDLEKGHGVPENAISVAKGFKVEEL